MLEPVETKIFYRGSIELALVKISANDCSNFTDTLEILDPLKHATEALSGDTFPTLNMEVPPYMLILNHLENLAACQTGDSDEAASNFKVRASKAAFDKLNKYYNILSKLCMIATVLDSRLKLYFNKADTRTSAVRPQKISDLV